MSLNRIHQTLHLVTLVALVAASCWSVSVLRAAAPLKVSDYGDLQAAIDAADDGDTILVDVDTPGALLDKRLTLQGPAGKGAGGLITQFLLTQGPIGVAGIALLPGASGSSLVNLRIATTSGRSIVASHDNGIPVEDVTIKGCSITSSGTGILVVQGNGFTIEHNVIELQESSSSIWIGILLTASEDTRVAHNVITGSSSDGVSALRSGVRLNGGTRIEIVQNRISVSHPSMIDAVSLLGALPLEDVTVAMNDFRGTDPLSGDHGVFFVGTVGPGGDLTGLGAFDLLEVPSPPATLIVGGNLASGSDGRGELSESLIPLDELLHP